MMKAVSWGLFAFTAVGWLCIIVNFVIVPHMKSPPSDFVWLGSWLAAGVLIGCGVGMMVAL
jgi:hypothetical protein